ncbi:hypothetical protein I79_016506 [Cricetulus griseus]|uniref:Uncharacterized protein n=1 Tax=Cricetulus griseus TaxID=10029 RepID=G3HZK0_CRIGR|nr:hypothetical protein I79_016506 [Cricetulus griseus]
MAKHEHVLYQKECKMGQQTQYPDVSQYFWWQECLHWVSEPMQNNTWHNYEEQKFLNSLEGNGCPCLHRHSRHALPLQQK